MEHLAAIFSEFPTEVFGVPIVVLIYILRLMNKRAVTVADLMRTERKMEVIVQRHSEITRDRLDGLRREFDDKLQSLRNELGGY